MDEEVFVRRPIFAMWFQRDAKPCNAIWDDIPSKVFVIGWNSSVCRCFRGRCVCVVEKALDDGSVLSPSCRADPERTYCLRENDINYDVLYQEQTKYPGFVCPWR